MNNIYIRVECKSCGYFANYSGEEHILHNCKDPKYKVSLVEEVGSAYRAISVFDVGRKTELPNGFWLANREDQI